MSTSSSRLVTAPPATVVGVERWRRERSKLRRELGRLDAVCLLIAAIVVLDTLGAVARGGPQTITWLAIVAALFFLPAGLVIAELGAAVPHQGGPYVWARLAFGRLAGSLVALTWWLETPVWVGGSLAITAVAVFDRLLVPLAGGWQVLVALGFIWTATTLAVVPLRTGKRVPLAGAVTQVSLLGFFTATVVLFAAQHGVRGLAAGALVPTWAVLVVVGPVLVYCFLGFELPSTAAEELRDPQRDVPASIVRAGVLTCALYGVPVLAIVLVVPAGQLSSLTGFIDALASVLVVYGPWSGPVGALAAAAFIWVLLANALTWIMGASRTVAAAGLDGAAPGALARVSAHTGTPVRATITCGVIATATAAAAFEVAGGDNAKYFSVMLALAISLLALGNLVVFPALLRLRRTHPELPRPFRIPGGSLGAWTASGLATAWSALALVAVLWPGLATPTPDAYLPDGFAGDRAGFLLTELVPLALVVAAAAAFAYHGRRHDPRPTPREPAVTSTPDHRSGASALRGRTRRGRHDTLALQRAGPPDPRVGHRRRHRAARPLGAAPDRLRRPHRLRSGAVVHRGLHPPRRAGRGTPIPTPSRRGPAGRPPACARRPASSSSRRSAATTSMP